MWRTLWTIPVLAMVGCGAERTVTVTSEPSGALVWINGLEAGRTPFEYEFIDYGCYDVVVRKEGYRTLKTGGQACPPVYMIPPLDLAPELVGARDRQRWHFELKRAAAPGEDTQGLVARALELSERLESGAGTRAPATRPTTRAATQRAD